MENIKQMIDNLNDLAETALGFRPENSIEIQLLMAEAKVAELEAHNDFLENQNESLRNYVENTQKVFAALDLEEAKGCVFSERQLDLIKESVVYRQGDYGSNNIADSIISKIDAAKKTPQPIESPELKSKIIDELSVRNFRLGHAVTAFILELENSSNSVNLDSIEEFGNETVKYKAVAKISFEKNFGSGMILINLKRFDLC